MQEARAAAQIAAFTEVAQEVRDRQQRLEEALQALERQPGTETADLLAYAAGAVLEMRHPVASMQINGDLLEAVSYARYADGWRAGVASASCRPAASPAHKLRAI